MALHVLCVCFITSNLLVQVALSINLQNRNKKETDACEVIHAAGTWLQLRARDNMKKTSYSLQFKKRWTKSAKHASIGLALPASRIWQLSDWQQTSFDMPSFDMPLWDFKFEGSQYEAEVGYAVRKHVWCKSKHLIAFYRLVLSCTDVISKLAWPLA